jgi:hypothetical protein
VSRGGSIQASGEGEDVFSKREGAFSKCEDVFSKGNGSF